MLSKYETMGAYVFFTFHLVFVSSFSFCQVLMNLTNDNTFGCQQIAACGGLETMSSLIAGHFPSFSSSLSFFGEIKGDISSIELEHQNDSHLTDQELDLLVAILGLLVNLVEKDGHNRLILVNIFTCMCCWLAIGAWHGEASVILFVFLSFY